MSIKEFKIGQDASGVSVLGNYIVGKIVSVLQNTVIVSNGIETELIKKEVINILM